MDFGDATGLGKISCKYFILSAGGIPRSCFRDCRAICASARTGGGSGGQLTTTNEHGAQETAVKANSLFYWPPGHNVKIDADAEFITFSPQHEHRVVINHMIDKVSG